MTTDAADVDDEREGTVGHYEKLARKLLRRQLREFRDEHLAPAAYDLESSIADGDTSSGELSTFAGKAAEYAERSADILNRTRDMSIDHPALLLFVHGGEVFASLTKAGEWLTLDDDEKRRRGGATSGGGCPRTGTPARAAVTLRRVWRILDDVAEEHGEPLPEELRPPRDDDVDGDREADDGRGS